MVVIGAGSAGLVVGVHRRRGQGESDADREAPDGRRLPEHRLRAVEGAPHREAAGRRRATASSYGMRSAQRGLRFRRRDGARAARDPQIEPHDSVERYTELGVECLQGEAKIISPWAVEVTVAEQTHAHHARIVIAAGARPFVPPIPGLEQIELPDLRHRVGPARAARAAGGAGRRADRLRARAVLRAARLAGDAGGDAAAHPDARGSRASELVARAVPRRGHRRCSPATRRSSRWKQTAQKMPGRASTRAARCASSSTRCCARSAAWPIPTASGWRSSASPSPKQSTVEVNDSCRRSIPNIYACGDVAGPYQFTHAARTRPGMRR